MTSLDSHTTERRFTLPRINALAQNDHVRDAIAGDSSQSSSNLTNTSPKRSSAQRGDLQTPSPSPKRARREGHPASGTNGPGAAASSSRPGRSPSFWYADGNVVVKVDRVYFKLYRSRLARNCLYFDKLFADETGDYERRCATVEDCPVYHVPAELAADDFEKLLTVLETPLIFSNTRPTQNYATSLLHAAQSVSCEVVFKLAKDRLCALWDAERPPMAPLYCATLLPTTVASPSSSTPDPDVKRLYHDAIYIVLFARRHHIPELLKRAFYELLTSSGFWTTLNANRKQNKLTEDDLLRLYNARFVLQQRWRDAVVVAPFTDADGKSACRAEGYSCAQYHSRYYTSDRPQEWRSMIMQGGCVEAGTEDPMRYDILIQLTAEQRKRWCRGCLKAWEDTLTARRADWWAMFDNIQSLVFYVRAVSNLNAQHPLRF